MVKRILSVLIFLFLLSPVLSFGVSLTELETSKFEDYQFTLEELEYIKSRPTVLVGSDPQYAPIEFYENGVYKGLSIDYMNWIEGEFGINFKRHHYDSWSNIMDDLRVGKIDMASAISQTPERSNYLIFTDPYLSIPNILLVNTNFKGKINNDTFSEYTIGTIDGYAAQEYLELVYGGSNLVLYDDIEKCLTDLSLNKIDAVSMDVAHATYHIDKLTISNLQIYNDFDMKYTYNLTFGVSDDQELLHSILRKILNKMPSDIKDNIFMRWVHYEDDIMYSRKYLQYITLAAVIVTLTLVLVFVWWLTLKLSVRTHTKELLLLNIALEDKVRIRSEEISTLKEKVHESERLNSLSRLVVGISHEINTPLGNGIMMSSYLRNQINLVKDETIKESLVNHSDGIIKDLKKVNSKLEEFKAVATYQYEKTNRLCNLVNLIKDDIILICHKETFKGITVHYKVMEEVNYEISPRSLYHVIEVVFYNIVNHAYPMGKGEVHVSLIVEGNDIVFTISDFGMGIDGQALPQIFEPFYTTGEEQGHLGIGLYSAYNIVKGLFGAVIKVKSQVNQGTDVIIRFRVE